LVDVVPARAERPARILASVGVRPRKSRGQNFLVQGRIADRIVESLRICPGDNVIEIGPGLGILSERILRYSPAGFQMVESDARLAALLDQRFGHDPRVRAINQDFLATDVRALAGLSAVRVIGNLPFNLAGAMLERLCGFHDMIARMVLMFQREVAQRIRARPGMREHGALSVYTALYWDVGDHFRVGGGSFHPRPKVDAEVLVFTPRSEPAFAPEEEHTVLATVRAAFSAPRKTIRNSLAGGLGLDSPEIESALARARLDPSVRPATLTVSDLVRLSRTLVPSPLPQSVRDA
jgi:16S rRNA (adenine1518-N6/adenine1519-N6)-dimethyltransferase